MSKKPGLVQKLLLCSFFTLASTHVHAQITPDNTLREEASRFTPNVLIKDANADLINGGALRSNNLFHSFSEFNIKDGQRVYFANPSGVVNILTRVTGSNASNILGTLGVDGAANLFLINPNGILFGQNASLDVRGSFVGTTANGVQFGNQGNFSATNPQAPALLTINPSALLFNQINPNAAIQNNSVALLPEKDPAGFNVFGLRVPDGKSLLLVGGDVIMDGGQLNAYGGRVELGGLVETGNIGLDIDSNTLTLNFPKGVQRGDVSFTNQAVIFVIGSDGGSVAMNARSINIFGGSAVFAGIREGLGTSGSQAGNVTLNATDKITLAQGSFIGNFIQPQAKGNAGDIIINAGSFSQQDGSRLETFTSGQGNAGNVTINASKSVSLSGFETAILSNVEDGGIGKGGNININAASFSLLNGAQLQTLVRGASKRMFEKSAEV